MRRCLADDGERVDDFRLIDTDAAVERDPGAGSPSPLVTYALKGLERCWMPQRRRFSFSYRFTPSGGANLSRRQGDTYYTLNVLLGLSRIYVNSGSAGPPIGLVYRDCCHELTREDFVPYAYGMALWAGAALGLDPPAPLIDRVRNQLLNERRLEAMTAQDLALLASGSIAMSALDPKSWRGTAASLVRRIEDRYLNHNTSLFYNQERGLRRNFSSFASQVYPLLALYQYGEAFDAPRTIARANICAEKLIHLQGPQGEWAWFYDVPRGMIVDFYEIYSVHQHGMAPAFLHHAVKYGVAGARESLVAGFEWLFGNNQMGAMMLHPPQNLFYRSQLRSGERDTTTFRVGRSSEQSLETKRPGRLFPPP